MKECEVDFNPEFTARVIPKLDWREVVRAAQSLGQLGDTPTEVPMVSTDAKSRIKLSSTWLSLGTVHKVELVDPCFLLRLLSYCDEEIDNYTGRLIHLFS